MLHIYFEILISLLENCGLFQGNGHLINKWNLLNAFVLALHEVLKLAVIHAPATQMEVFTPHPPSLFHTHSHLYLHSPSHPWLFPATISQSQHQYQSQPHILSISMSLCCPGVQTMKQVSKNILNACYESNLCQKRWKTNMSIVLPLQELTYNLRVT